MGFGSYKTAWTWLHKVRAALMRPEREPLGPFVQMDKALVGGKGGPHKELVLVAAEADGRVRLAHAETNDKATLERFADRQIAPMMWDPARNSARATESCSMLSSQPTTMPAHFPQRVTGI